MCRQFYEDLSTDCPQFDNFQRLFGCTIDKVQEKDYIVETSLFKLYMQYKFTKFEGRNSKFEHRITITSSNSFGFPAKFYTDNKIGDSKYAVLFWDAENKAIGIHFTNDEQEKSKFGIVKTSKYGATLSAKSFFTKNDIDPKKNKGKYDWEKINEPGVGDIYVIKLKKEEELNSKS